MATDGRNIGSEIFKSLSQGLMTYAGERQREQAEERQNALQAFTATLQMQQANRQQLESVQRMAGLALENRAKDIQLKELLEKQKDPEAYARKQAQAKLAEENQMIAGRFGADLAPFQANLSGLMGAAQAGRIQLPDNAQMRLGDLTLRGPDPMAQIKADYTKALTEQAQSTAAKNNAGSTGSMVSRLNTATRVWSDQLDQAQKEVTALQEEYNNLQNEDIARFMGKSPADILEIKNKLDEAKKRRDMLSQGPAEQIGILVGQLFGDGSAPAGEGQDQTGGLNIDALIAELETLLGDTAQ